MGVRGTRETGRRGGEIAVTVGSRYTRARSAFVSSMQWAAVSTTVGVIKAPLQRPL